MHAIFEGGDTDTDTGGGGIGSVATATATARAGKDEDKIIHTKAAPVFELKQEIQKDMKKRTMKRI